MLCLCLHIKNESNGRSYPSPLSLSRWASLYASLSHTGTLLPQDVRPVCPRYMQQHNEVELSAPEMAIATVVTVAEILKNNRLVVEKKIMTSTVDMRDETRGRPVQKAKIEILLGKTEKFDELMAAVAEERELAEAEDQS